MSMFDFLVGLGCALLIAALWVIFKPQWGRKTAVATVVSGFVIAVFVSSSTLYPEYLGWRFESDLQQQPLFNLIAKHHPKEYSAFMQKVKQGFRQHLNQDVVSVYSADLVNKVFYRHLENSPNDYINLYLKATIDLYRHLNGLDPRAVINLENGDGVLKFDISSLWEDKDFRALLDHLLDTKKRVIEASIQTPQSAPDPKQAEVILKGVLNNLESKYGEKTVRSVFNGQIKDISSNVVAQIIIEFYADILGSGKENAGTVIRYIASLKAKAMQAQQIPMHS